MGDEGEGSAGAATGVPTEQEVAPVLQKMLREEDLDKMTLRKIMNSLCEHFDVSLKDLAVRKKYVRLAIESFLESDYKPEAGRSTNKNEDDVENSEEDDDDDNDDNDDDDDGFVVEDEDDDEAPKKKNPKKRKRKSSSGSPAGPKMGVAGTQVKLSSFERAVVLKEPLEKFLNEKVLPRTHVAKRITAYAKENSLQDTADRRKINCDAALTALFDGETEFTFFSINKLIPNLLYKREEIADNEQLMALCAECDERTLAEKQRIYDDKVARGEPVGKGKATKGRSTKKMKENGETPKRKQPDYQLSKELQEVCGGEEVMSRMQVMKKIWVYIKEKKLNEGKVIHCDDNLKAIFDGEESVGMGFMKYLTPHLTKM